MKFTTVDKLPGAAFRPRKLGKIQAFLQDFADSHVAVARVDVSEKEYVSISSCRSALLKSARKMNLDHIKTSIRGGEVYLINTLLLEDET